MSEKNAVNQSGFLVEKDKQKHFQRQRSFRCAVCQRMEGCPYMGMRTAGQKHRFGKGKNKVSEKVGPYVVFDQFHKFFCKKSYSKVAFVNYV